MALETSNFTSLDFVKSILNITSPQVLVLIHFEGKKGMSTTSSDNKGSKKDLTQMNGEDDDQKTILGFDLSIFWTGIISVLLVIILWVLTIIIFKNWEPNKRGTFGDMFGATNALFSGLAFAGLIFTILLQRKELELQRKELRDTRAEFEQQNKTLLFQRFETTFYKLLEFNRETLLNLTYKTPHQMFTGRGQLISPNSELTGAVVLGLVNYKTMNLEGYDVSSLYRQAITDFSCSFDSYVGSMYNLIEIVDNHIFIQFEPDSENELINHQFRLHYIKTLINVLNINELDFLFYYCLTNERFSFLKAFLEKYSFFQFLDKDYFLLTWSEQYEHIIWQKTNPVHFLSTRGLL